MNCTVDSNVCAGDGCDCGSGDDARVYDESEECGDDFGNRADDVGVSVAAAAAAATTDAVRSDERNNVDQSAGDAATSDVSCVDEGDIVEDAAEAAAATVAAANKTSDEGDGGTTAIGRLFIDKFSGSDAIASIAI